MTYLRARSYNPARGVFTTEDPARDGLNWYSYCGGNPVMFVDPTGKLRETDGQYNSLTQVKLLEYTVDYYNAKMNNDKLGMATVSLCAELLRTEKIKWD